MTENLPQEVLRALIFENLSTADKTQFVNILQGVEELAKSKGYYLTNDSYRYGGIATEHKMPSDDREIVRQLIWDMVFSGILVPGSDEHNMNLPHLRVTEFGKKCIKEKELIPYDPEGFIVKFKQKVPNADDTILFYLTESLTCLRYNCNTASTIMIGAASEKTILLLIAAVENSIKEEAEKIKFKKSVESSFTIKKKYDILIEKLKEKKDIFPRQMSEDVDTNLSGIFNLIRKQRNDAGHPSGKTIQREEAFANLQLFPSYVKYVYDIIKFCEENKI